MSFHNYTEGLRWDCDGLAATATKTDHGRARFHINQKKENIMGTAIWETVHRHLQRLKGVFLSWGLLCWDLRSSGFLLWGLLFIFLMIPGWIFAQPSFPDDPDQIPVDGGLALLAAAGLGVAAKKFRERRRDRAEGE